MFLYNVLIWYEVGRIDNLGMWYRNRRIGSCVKQCSIEDCWIHWWFVDNDVSSGSRFVGFVVVDLVGSNCNKWQNAQL